MNKVTISYFNLLLLEAFMENSIKILVKYQELNVFGFNSLEFEGVIIDKNIVLLFIFDKSILSPIIKSAILDELKK